MKRRECPGVEIAQRLRAMQSRIRIITISGTALAGESAGGRRLLCAKDPDGEDLAWDVNRFLNNRKLACE